MVLTAWLRSAARRLASQNRNLILDGSITPDDRLPLVKFPQQMRKGQRQAFDGFASDVVGVVDEFLHGIVRSRARDGRRLLRQQPELPTRRSAPSSPAARPG